MRDNLRMKFTPRHSVISRNRKELGPGNPAFVNVVSLHRSRGGDFAIKRVDKSTSSIRMKTIALLLRSSSSRIFTAPNTTPFQTTRTFRSIPLGRAESEMAGKASLKRAEDFVDFLNASPTRMHTVP